VQFDWEGTANKFEKAMNDAKADATSKANEIVQLKHQITDLTGVINAVKNMHKLSDLQNNAIIPPDIKNAVSTVVDSIHGVKRDFVVYRNRNYDTARRRRRGWIYFVSRRRHQGA
jgi:hypothetical protein